MEMQRFPLSALLVEQDSCCLVLPLAEEAFVKSAKGLNQKLEGVVTTGAPHLGHIPYPLLKFCFLCPPCSCLHEYVTSHKVFHCCHFPKLFLFLSHVTSPFYLFCALHWVFHLPMQGLLCFAFSLHQHGFYLCGCPVSSPVSSHPPLLVWSTAIPFWGIARNLKCG